MRLTIRDQAADSPPGAAALTGWVLIAPPALLLFVGLSSHVGVPWRLWAGAAVACILGLVVHRHFGKGLLRNAAGVLPAAIAVISMWLARPDPRAATPHLALATLLLTAVVPFAVLAVRNTGAVTLRRARKLAQRLAARRDWPAALSACRTLPAVRPLRDALTAEAGPVMPLLSDPRPQVRVAALGALEFRRNWRAGQPDVVLTLAQTADQPEVRTAALLALAGVQQRLLIEAMGESLRDPDPGVRRAAAEALLWDCDRRWLWIRNAVREALADPRLLRDGPLTVPKGTLSQQAVSDLSAWAMESGTLGTRATQSLSLYYTQKLAESTDPQLIAHLCDLVSHPRASTVLRVELAQLLKQHGHLPDDLMLRLVEPTTPSPLRLMAVEAMLERFPNERAVEVLREVARQPNRELALAAAVVVQKFLHLDMGLALGVPPPPLHSREAAEVTRRVIEWAKEAVPAGEPVTQGSGW
jgi:HEAT repeat protein